MYDLNREQLVELRLENAKAKLRGFHVSIGLSVLAIVTIACLIYLSNVDWQWVLLLLVQFLGIYFNAMGMRKQKLLVEQLKRELQVAQLGKPETNANTHFIADDAASGSTRPNEKGDS